MARKKARDKRKNSLPLIPLRNLVVFPRMIVPLFIGREKSIIALEKALDNSKQIVLATQKREKKEEPVTEDICDIGTLVEIIQVLKLPDETTKILVEGQDRVKIKNFVKTNPYFDVTVEKIEEEKEDDVELNAICRVVLEQFERYVKSNRKIPTETIMSVVNIEEPGRLADIVASYLMLRASEKQQVLETVSVKKRLKLVEKFLGKEIEVIEVETKLHIKVKDNIEKIQKEYYLKEKLKAIRQELGEEEAIPEVEEYRTRIKEAKMSKEAEKQALREVDRLQKMPTMSSEAGVIRTYLDWLIELPWYKKTKERLDIREVEKILNEEHYGLEKVKERILEYFAVFNLTEKVQGSILCLVGPPGVGKTSVGNSIANAMNRKFVRISLGGVRDEAELRGHRRTYVGALPGRIIKAVHKSKYKNPVILLDEIDKMSSDFRGDPSAALMEILDPEQNKNFSDHYLEVPFDLSDVIFIGTANSLDPVPRALIDRMEVIELNGYTEEEKIEIAKQFLIPKQLEKNGLKSKQIKFIDEGLRLIIREYTKEVGLREIERGIASICRKAAKIVLGKGKTPIKINKPKIRKFLGPRKFKQEKIDEKNQIGVVNGLAWTQYGGDSLPVEVSVLKGKGKLTLTGKLGDVMKESAQAAMSYVRSRAAELGIDENFHRRKDIHIHVPEGAVPKDGPSGGIAIATALASALSGIAVKREVAMTGEITLRGRVLEIGGLKEKSMAAYMMGVKTIIIPKDNEKDLPEIPKKIRKKVKFVLAGHMDDVLKASLVKMFSKIKSRKDKEVEKIDINTDIEDKYLPEQESPPPIV